MADGMNTTVDKRYIFNSIFVVNTILDGAFPH